MVGVETMVAFVCPFAPHLARSLYVCSLLSRIARLWYKRYSVTCNSTCGYDLSCVAKPANPSSSSTASHLSYRTRVTRRLRTCSISLFASSILEPRFTWQDVISLLIDYVLLKDRCTLSYITSSTNPCCNPNRVSSMTGKGRLRLFTYLFCCDSAQADPEAL